MDSNAPTLPPGYRHLERWKQLLGALMVICTSVGTASATIYSYYDKLATDVELQQHNEDLRSHVALIDPLNEHVKLVEQQLKNAVENEIAVGERVVSLLAADREPDRRLHSAAGKYYADLFRQLVESGVPPKKAMFDALNQPWYTRPNTR